MDENTVVEPGMMVKPLSSGIDVTAGKTYKVEAVYGNNIEFKDDVGDERSWVKTSFELVDPIITFDDAMERFLKHLPHSTTHIDITPDLRAYRSARSYLSLKVKKVEIDYFKSREQFYLDSPAAQAHLKQAFELLDEYEETQKPVELTMDEIASKFNISVDKLRIKE